MTKRRMKRPECAFTVDMAPIGGGSGETENTYLKIDISKELVKAGNISKDGYAHVFVKEKAIYITFLTNSKGSNTQLKEGSARGLCVRLNTKQFVEANEWFRKGVDEHGKISAVHFTAWERENIALDNKTFQTYIRLDLPANFWPRKDTIRFDNMVSPKPNIQAMVPSNQQLQFEEYEEDYENYEDDEENYG